MVLDGKEDPTGDGQGGSDKNTRMLISCRGTVDVVRIRDVRANSDGYRVTGRSRAQHQSSGSKST